MTCGGPWAIRGTPFLSKLRRWRDKIFLAYDLESWGEPPQMPKFKLRDWLGPPSDNTDLEKDACFGRFPPFLKVRVKSGDTDTDTITDRAQGV